MSQSNGTNRRRMLAGRAEAIWATRDQKLEAARAARRVQWQGHSTARQAALTVVH